MEFNTIRPLFSGLVGAAIAVWLNAKLMRWVPETYDSMTPEELLGQHAVAVKLANVLFIAGIFFGVALYKFASFSDSDWRPMALGFGLASVMPLIALPLISVAMGRSPKAAYAAFAIGQKTPVFVTYGILGLGVVAFFFAVASLGT